MKVLKKEAIVFAVFLLAGLLLIPVAIYVAGGAVFTDYQQYQGLGEFLGAFYRSLGALAKSTWFIVFSPYLVIQCLRLSWRAMRGPRKVSRETAASTPGEQAKPGI